MRGLLWYCWLSTEWGYKKKRGNVDYDNFPENTVVSMKTSTTKHLLSNFLSALFIIEFCRGLACFYLPSIFDWSFAKSFKLHFWKVSSAGKDQLIYFWQGFNEYWKTIAKHWQRCSAVRLCRLFGFAFITNHLNIHKYLLNLKKKVFNHINSSVRWILRLFPLSLFHFYFTLTNAPHTRREKQCQPDCAAV